METESEEKSDRKGCRWPRIVVGMAVAIVVVLLGAIGVIYALSERAINKHWDVDPVTPSVSTDPGAVERGRAVATFRGCRDCHGPDLGGRVFIDAMPVMRLVAPNITPAGVVSDYTGDDWARVVRHGVKPDGRPALFMPSYEWTQLSVRDMGDMLAFLQAVPPVEREFDQETSIGPVGRTLYLAGELPLLPAEMIDHELKPVDPKPGPTAAYGSYLITGCTGCHGEHLSGGPIPGVPPSWPEAPNLTSHETGLADWDRDQFVTTLRTGQTPEGREIRAEYMPWKFIGESSDDDLTALWLYLREIEPREHGNR